MTVESKQDLFQIGIIVILLLLTWGNWIHRQSDNALIKAVADKNESIDATRRDIQELRRLDEQRWQFIIDRLENINERLEELNK